MTGINSNPGYNRDKDALFQSGSQEPLERLRLLLESSLKIIEQLHSRPSRQDDASSSSHTLWLPSEAIRLFSSDNKGLGDSNIFRIRRLSEWSHGEWLLGAGVFPKEAYSSCVNDTKLASYLGGMVAAFPTRSYGFEAAQAISRLDDSLLPLVVAIALSRSDDDWPQEEVLPLLQRVHSSSSTRMLEELALECILPHVRVPAILAIAERDYARAERVKERVWSGMDIGTREWLEEDLADIRARHPESRDGHALAPLYDALATPGSLLSGLRTPFKAFERETHEDLTAFRQAVLGAAFQSVGLNFNPLMFTERVSRLGIEFLFDDLSAAVPKADEDLALWSLERVEAESGETLVRAVKAD